MEPDFVKTVRSGCAAGRWPGRMILDGSAVDDGADRFLPVSNIFPCRACAAEIVREAACPVQ